MLDGTLAQLINELVRLSAEVARLQARVTELEAAKGATVPEPSREKGPPR